MRIAPPADAPLLLSMQREFYTCEGYPFDDAQKERAMHELLAHPQFGRIVLLDNDAGYLVLAFGFSLEFGGRDAFVDELFVLPHARGRGLGTRALEIAEEICAAEGIHALHLEVEFENESAKRLYARRGYDQHSRILMTKRVR